MKVGVRKLKKLQEDIARCVIEPDFSVVTSNHLDILDDMIAKEVKKAREKDRSL